MPLRDQPTRREADKAIVEIMGGVKMLLSIFDIDLADPEKARAAAVEANKDIRFLRAFRDNTNQSLRQARKLTIASLFAAMIAFFARSHGSH